MNYNEAIEFIHQIPKFVRPLGNAKLAKLLELMGNPQDKLKFVHAAGTNGKGSVCSMTAEILKRSGYKTGLFTSPFIVVFNERIQINNDLISDDDLAELVTEVADIMQKNDISVSEFAFITVAAMKYFADKACDIVVLETGMGGRLDATNIIKNTEVAVLTKIGLDHMQYLGDTVDEIAKEKCGIIKPGCEVISAKNEKVSYIIEQSAKVNGAELTFIDDYISRKNKFVYKTWSYHLGLGGRYQAENAVIALETIKALQRRGWNISAQAIHDGFSNAYWPARYERVRDNLIIDGGHNIDGIRALKESLLEENRPVVLVMAMMKDKSYEVCVHTIASAAKYIVATEINMPRCLKAIELQKILANTQTECILEPDIAKAIIKAEELAGKQCIICICGSLYLAGEAKKILAE